MRRKIINQISANVCQNQSLGIIRPEVDTELFAELLVTFIERIVIRYGMDEDEGYSPEILGRSLGSIIFHGVLKKK